MFALDERIAELRKEKIEKIRHGICQRDMDVLRRVAEQLSVNDIAIIIAEIVGGYSTEEINMTINEAIIELADLQASMDVLNEH